MADTNEASMSVDGSAPERRLRSRRVGVVTSDKGNQTIKVTVNYLTRHRKYGKYLRRRTSLHAHDAGNEARIGDRVELMMCHPISKMKRWRLVRVLGRA